MQELLAILTASRTNLSRIRQLTTTTTQRLKDQDFQDHCPEPCFVRASTNSVHCPPTFSVVETSLAFENWALSRNTAPSRSTSPHRRVPPKQNSPHAATSSSSQLPFDQPVSRRKLASSQLSGGLYVIPHAASQNKLLSLRKIDTQPQRPRSRQLVSLTRHPTPPFPLKAETS